MAVIYLHVNYISICLSVSSRAPRSLPQPWDLYQCKVDWFEEKGVLRLQPLNVPTATDEF